MPPRKPPADDQPTPDPTVAPIGEQGPETLVVPEPDPEPAFDALASGRLIETPQAPPPPALYGFEEAPRECTILLDEPDPVVEEPAGPEAAVGSFVGLGVEHLSRADGEWLVDPDTGCITGPA